MNDKIEENELLITKEVESAISKKIEALTANDPKLKMVFPIVVFGSEYDEKPVYVGYFRQPSFASFSKYLAASQSSQAVAMRTLANDCFLDGDKELIDDDSLFLFGLMGQLSKIIEMRHGKLVNLSKLGK